MDPQLREFANELARTFEERVKKNSDEFEERVKQHFDASEERVKQHFDASEERVKQHFDASEERVKQHIDAFEERAETRMQMHFDNLESSVNLAAEGYGATLDRIERDLAELRSTATTGFADVTKTLHNHNERISALEQSRP